MANKHGDFIWYELLTPDQDGARKFYSEVVGWTIEARATGPMDYRMIAAPDGIVGGSMTLTPELAAHGARPVWLGYIGVEHVDRCVASITAAGGKTLMSPQDIPGVGRFAMVTDPQGVPFYVMRGASDETSHSFAADKPRIGHCAWNELATSDQRAAMAFYTSQFGWKKDGEMDMGPMGKYEFLNHGGQIGAMMTKVPQQSVPAWTYYFRVASIDVSAAKITSGGGQILHGPQEVPGEDWIINGMDPQGAMFALVGART